MRTTIRTTALLGTLALAATPALAQDETAPPPPVTVTGSVAAVSDYRFRGVSWSDDHPAVQAGVTVAHESGVYAGAWGSTLSDWGRFGGGRIELDLLAGVRLPVGGGGTLDLGATAYLRPGRGDDTTVIEPYAKLSGTIGPLSATAGAAYAPEQRALGRAFRTGAAAAAGTLDDVGDKQDNLYLWGDFAAGVPTTPFTLRAHIGHSNGNRGLGPNATSLSPTGTYWDWSLGADYAWRGLILNVSYVDTDISRREARYLLPSFSRGQDGTGSIAGATLVASVTATF